MNILSERFRDYLVIDRSEIVLYVALEKVAIIGLSVFLVKLPEVLSHSVHTVIRSATFLTCTIIGNEALCQFPIHTVIDQRVLQLSVSDARRNYYAAFWLKDFERLIALNLILACLHVFLEVVSVLQSVVLVSDHGLFPPYASA